MTGLNLTDSCPGQLEGFPAALFFTLLNSLMAAKCSLSNPGNYPEDYGPQLSDNDEFDFIVVGSGSAGPLVAHALTENPDWKVLVIEAGGIPSAASDIPALAFSVQNTKDDWAYRTQPNPNSCLGLKNKQCSWPRGKVLGGSSCLNAMLYVKGNKRDYDKWSELGNPGWDWENVRGYFERLERLEESDFDETPLGVQGLMWLTKKKSKEPVKMSIQQAFEELGVKYKIEQDPEDPIGTVDLATCIRKGERANTGRQILGSVKNRTNLYVAMNTFVEKLIINDRKTEGVQVQINGKVLNLKAKKEVVVSAGAINSPQLLMLSGIGPKDHLQNLGIEVIKDLPVGKHLQDHLITLVDVKLSENSIISPKHPADPLYEYFLHREGLIAGVSFINFVSFINTKNDSKWPNFQHHFLPSMANDQFIGPAIDKGVAFDDDTVKIRRASCQNNPCVSMVQTLLQPESTGVILLNTTNPTDPPLIYNGYLTDEADQDMQSMLEAIRFTERLLETESYRKHRPEIIRYHSPECDKLEFRSDEYWECFTRHFGTTLYHPASTCRMGPDEQRYVVDARLRVHGVKNLRVADASVMPDVVSGNTHAPCMMIGLKAGEMIAEDWARPNEEL
ncbi:unnamed protein product [Phyllotreta striolata]|uniref:Glucose-methanol-choline oxidoreductase N-terminal domain-containing protein n=1 Tax=Phyllotreta striolata TaxID=444603 RepID=A0A9N9TLX9_PHYSR|nr:unnamed protein product [Phyllotreta striolata]